MEQQKTKKVSDMVRVPVGVMEKVEELGYESATQYFKDLESGRLHTGNQNAQIQLLRLLETQSDLKAKIAELETENRFLTQHQQQLGSLPSANDLELKNLQFEHRYIQRRNDELEDQVKKLKRENQDLEDQSRKAKLDADDEVRTAKRNYNIVDKAAEVAPGLVGAFFQAKTGVAGQAGGLQGVEATMGVDADDVHLLQSIHATIPEEELDHFKRMIFSLSNEGFRKQVFSLAEQHLAMH